MLKDSKTNTVYISSLLKTKHKEFATRLCSILAYYNIPVSNIDGTKDIWCRDYMPIQVDINQAIQFRFEPTYLNYKKYKHLKTNVSEIVYPRFLAINYSDIILDGGNVVKWDDAAILTTRLYLENDREKDTLVCHLKDLLKVERVIVIPQLPNDYTGHADGMVRFIDKNTVLLNDYSGSVSRRYWKNIISVFHNHDLEVILLPNAFPHNKTFDDATGDYINFLQVGNLIILPQYGYTLDSIVKEEFKKRFPGYIIESIAANEISKEGGVLNCVTWTVYNNSVSQA